jgi:uncharacterized protein (DUF1697 family)
MMPRYVAFLRGINLGKRRPPMSQLKTLFEDAGFTKVETFIASGNVIFDSNSKDQTKLESKIAKHLEEALGYEVDTFVRSAEQLIAISRSKVFEEEAAKSHALHVCFLHETLNPSDARKLEKIQTKDDAFKAAGREYYWLCRVKIVDSDVWKSPEMKALRLPDCTMRNITSIRKLVAKHLS